MHKSLPIIFALLFLGGCTYIPDIPGITPYKMDIQQGNIFTPAQVAALRPGMNKARVILIFGTPLLKDPFHADRWDYIYTMQYEGKLIDKRHIALFFKDGLLVRIDDGNPADAARFNAATPVQSLPGSKALPTTGIPPGSKSSAQPGQEPTSPSSAPVSASSPGTGPGMTPQPKESKSSQGQSAPPIGATSQ